ncbi:hypothetical protein F4820DRAFT_432492 [Hypoxylon rubiginosum]|uniref:Uncharacterized protein n=1 Tax=Hypoxylon rubiginosum TaxID=110542 RepID=A0ACB9YRB3_9PEZI|nr:hypothetical protein F4820DRAFT_432492 [Hypoxylon rubiginosum]
MQLTEPVDLSTKEQREPEITRDTSDANASVNNLKDEPIIAEESLPVAEDHQAVLEKETISEEPAIEKLDEAHESVSTLAPESKETDSAPDPIQNDHAMDQTGNEGTIAENPAAEEIIKPNTDISCEEVPTKEVSVPNDEPQPEAAYRNIEEPVNINEDMKEETPAETISIQPAAEKPASNDQPEPKEVSEEKKAEDAKIQDDDESKDEVGPIPGEGGSTRRVMKGEDQLFSSLVDTPGSVPGHLISVNISVEGGESLKEEKQATTEIPEPSQPGESLQTIEAPRAPQESDIQLSGEAVARIEDNSGTVNDDTRLGGEGQDTQNVSEPREIQEAFETQGKADVVEGNVHGGTASVLAHEHHLDTETSDGPRDLKEEEPKDPEPPALPIKSEIVQEQSSREPGGLDLKPSELPSSPPLDEQSEKDAASKENLLPGPSKSVEFVDTPVHAPPREISDSHIKESIPIRPLAQDVESEGMLSHSAGPESPDIVAPTTPLSEPFTVIKREAIPQKSSKRSLRPPLIHSGTQTEDDYDFISRQSPSPFESPFGFINLADSIPRSATPAVILPDLTDSNARALGRARSVKKQRRQTLKQAEETVAAAVVIYAAVRGFSPPPSPQLGSSQAEKDVAEVLEPTQEYAQKSDEVSSLSTPGVNQSVGQNDFSLPVADLDTDDEERKSTDERHHRHRHHHHHHSSRSRDSKDSGEHLHRRRESNLSVKSTRSSKRDSGFSIDSSRTGSSSSRRHRTPEEQAAHEKRKEERERRAAREAYEKEREGKGKEPEVAPSDRPSHRSSRRHSTSYSEKTRSERHPERSHSDRHSERSHSERHSERPHSERHSERPHSERHSERSQTERHSEKPRSERPVSKEGTPPLSKKFFDTKNVESVLAPNSPTRPRSNSTNVTPPVARETAKSGTSLKRSNTAKSHKESADGSRTNTTSTGKSHSKDSVDVPRNKSHRSIDESSKRRKLDTKNSTAAAEPSESKVSQTSEGHKHSRREERQKAREAEAEAKKEGETKKKPSGIRAAFKKIFS